jgi:hypothetical protein
MGAKHRMTQLPEGRRQPDGRHVHRRTPRSTMVLGIASTSMLCATTLAALAVNIIEPEKTTETATEAIHRSPPAPQPVSQEGTLIAVSADSVTARSANGYTQTYLVTPKTTVFTNDGSQPATVASHFTVNEEVDIVGTIQGGTALATAVADRELGQGNGPPMDYVAAQPSGST